MLLKLLRKHKKEMNKIEKVFKRRYKKLTKKSKNIISYYDEILLRA